MPEMDGIALARAVRAEFPSVPLILMSGYINVEQMRDLRVDFLPKPMSLATLIATIEKVTTGKKEPRSETEYKSHLDPKREAGG